MAGRFFRLKAFISWWLEAVDDHSLHSPFFFDLYTRILKPAVPRKQFDHIERLRQKLFHDARTIRVRDYGSRAAEKEERRISDIARTSLSPPRFLAFYARLVECFDARSIVELGSSFGISTLYLAEKQNASVTTFEGAPVIAGIATLTFEFAGRKNINLIEGDIDKTLPEFLQRIRRIDFALVDANHRYEPTVRYVEWLLRKFHDKSILVVDDIHHSEEMERAWKVIKNHRLVYATADLFRCGIVFFDPSLNKQHVILQI